MTGDALGEKEQGIWSGRDVSWHPYPDLGQARNQPRRGSRGQHFRIHPAGQRERVAAVIAWLRLDNRGGAEAGSSHDQNFTGGDRAGKVAGGVGWS